MTLHEQTNERDDERLKALLRTVDATSVPPDRTALARLRDLSTDAFVSASTDRSSPLSDGASQPVQIISRPSEYGERRSQVTLFAMRTVVAAVVSLVIGVATFLASRPAPVEASSLVFGAILEELRETTSLEFKLFKQGTESGILVRKPGLVRKTYSPTRYEIAAGSRLWRVDEESNSVTENDSPFTSGSLPTIDLVKLLDVDLTDTSDLLRAKPIERRSYAGYLDAFHGEPRNAANPRPREPEPQDRCFVYRVNLPAKVGRIRVEALVREQDHRLMGLFAWPQDAARKAGPPIAELRLIAVNQAIADEEFKISPSLSEDGRIGQVAQAQGIVVLRPMVAKRWTPVGVETILKPGDWLRTELRGAHAVKIVMTSGTAITLGPGSLVECISPGQCRLHEGFVQVRTADAPAADRQEQDKRPAGTISEFRLLAPREGERVIPAGNSQRFRVDRDDRLVDVTQTPTWLAAFEGTSNNESLGSLIVNLPDGRNEPLRVGFHQVSVEIRDQIARTTIIESFVNNTPGQLEGTFHFPLPQDASISGFGMWIGNQLVEADVVEKQRAREIYETILREKRDPGLLEWTGGNIFKARVFPIEPHSEKRIKIVYTQVLPLQGNQYRYHYGLRNELLRTHPLRELSLSVTVNSAIPLKSVRSLTHSVRTQQTRHSAQVDFAAQEYVPTRDFEVVCEIEGEQSDVVVIPHQRGDDGYFLVQIMAPLDPTIREPGSSRLSQIIPDSDPISLILVCDTSGSMDAEKRKQQRELVASILASLGTSDQFRIVACDVEPVWASEKSLNPTPETIAAALKFLDDRASLGWTNLDRAFESVNSQSPPGSHVIYIGDGIATAADTDPAAFVKRFGQIIKPKASGAINFFHTVTVGNSYESIVMRGIARVGGGSTRAISAEQPAANIARGLLSEIASPGLKEMSVEFRGIKVAAVYPEQLPNLPPGHQQILVGRYLPGVDSGSRRMQGEVIVTGVRAGKRVKYVANVSFSNAEEGNSFIPRLWARSHLDQLLAQGQSEFVRDDIIRLSEDFHIITPYTSLLVLESDADRERFGVKRRFEMRDGERFFADGRNQASYELLQQQMKRAGNWRIGLRRRIQADLATYGRDSNAFQPLYGESLIERFAVSSSAIPMSGMDEDRDALYFECFPVPQFYSLGDIRSERGVVDRLGRANRMAGGIGGEIFNQLDTSPYSDQDSPVDFESLSDAPISLAKRARLFDGTTRMEPGLYAAEPFEDDAKTLREISNGELGLLRMLSPFGRKDLSYRGGMMPEGRAGKPYFGNYIDYSSWIRAIYPSIPPAPRRSTPPNRIDGFSEQTVAIARSLLRTESLLKIQGGIEIRRESDSYDPRWNRVTGRAVDLTLYSPKEWLTRNANPNEQTIVNFCNATERGAYSLAFELGQVRKSTSTDLQTLPFELTDSSISPVWNSFPRHSARTEPDGENRVLLILTNTQSPTNEIRLSIDTIRHVIVQQTSLVAGKITSRLVFDRFVEIAGRWWATLVTHLNDEGKIVHETRYEILTRTADQLTQRINEELSSKSAVQFTQLPLPSLQIARQHVADGSATFEDHMVMVLSNARVQQWDEMWRHVTAMETLGKQHAGVRWIRTLLLESIRRNEDARRRFADEVAKITDPQSKDAYFLAEFVIGHSQSIAAPSEVRIVQTELKSVYDRTLNGKLQLIANRQGLEDLDRRQQAEIERQRRLTWEDRDIAFLESMGRTEGLLERRRMSADATPWDVGRQQTYAQRLANAGFWAEAHEWLRMAISRPERTPDEDMGLRSSVADLYRQKADWRNLVSWTMEWVAKNPDSSGYSSAYAQHLSALIFNGQAEAACQLGETWLTQSQVEKELTGDQLGRIDAVLSMLSGFAFNLQIRELDERWHEPIASTARFFFRHRHNHDISERFMALHHFHQTDVADRLRGEWLSILRNELDQLQPHQVLSLVRWTRGGRIEVAEAINGRKQLDLNEVPMEIWTQIADRLATRWRSAEPTADKIVLTDALRQIYSDRFHETRYLPFLREALANAPDSHKQSYANDLFNALLSTAWTDDIETEVLAIWRRLYFRRPGGDATDEDQAISQVDRLRTELPALIRLVDAMLANRVSAAERQWSDQGGEDQLTRSQLATRKVEIQKAAERGLSARLGKEIDAERLRAANPDQPVQQTFDRADWLRMEQIWLDARSGVELAQIEESCWKILGETPVHESEEPMDDDSVDSSVIDLRMKQAFLNSLMRHRAFITLSNLATRKTATPALVERLTAFIDRGTSAAPGNVKDEDRQRISERIQTWRTVKYRFLVALDRADELEKQLREWIRIDISTGPWRQILARIVAERGKVDEAIQLFESCEKDRLLSHEDYQQLADWYLAVNRRVEYDRSRRLKFEMMPEPSLTQILYQTQQSGWRRGPQQPPLELTDETLMAIESLLKKSASPENYFWQLQNLYQSTHDFRLLKFLPNTIVGRTPQQVYAFLRNAMSTVLNDLRNEATADEIVSIIKDLRKDNLSSTDLRALDLFELLIERKSSEILNQSQPHVQACLAAMKRAFQRNWSDGEIRLMAEFLHSLGGFTNLDLRNEQIAELRALRDRTDAGSLERLVVTNHLCQLLFWNYTQYEIALNDLESEIQPFLQTQNGIWPYDDQGALQVYIGMLEGAQRHAKAEAVLTHQLNNSVNIEQQKWTRDRLLQLYNHALEHDGGVSLGTGRQNLLKPVINEILKDLAKASDEHARHGLIQRVCATFDIANRHRLTELTPHVESFAFETFPAAMTLQQQTYRGTVMIPLQIVRDVLGIKAALRFTVERIEQWPDRMKLSYESPWDTLGHELAENRRQVGTSDLDDRILKLVTSHLQSRLRQGDGSVYEMYHSGFNTFWSEKAADFANAAEVVLSERRTSGRRAMVVASFIRASLLLTNRSIEILLIANQRGLLDDGAQFVLASWLRDSHRHAEAISILEPLVRSAPENMVYRTELMTAYHRTQRPEQLNNLIVDTDQHFHGGGRWREDNVAQFARGCQASGVWDRAKSYFTEAIALRQRAMGDGVLNDALLSDYYQQLASIESNLKNTRAAVDAALGGVVCWGRTHASRNNALERLAAVLNAAQDLDDLVKQLNRESEASGQDSPLLRKAIGEAYQRRGTHREAIVQLKLAADLQPADKQTYQALIASYDALKEPSEATVQLLKLIDLQPHDLALLQQLADRLKAIPELAERAATSMIEQAPNESESHTALAEYRQNQNRWADAIPHWEQVAKLRSLEPTGLLKLAAAQIHESRWEPAKQSLQKLKKTNWPARFTTVDQEIRDLEGKLPN